MEKALATREASQVLNSCNSFGICQTFKFDTKIYYLAVTSFNRWRVANTSREAENLEQDKRVKLFYVVYHWEDISVIHHYHKLCAQTALFKQILELFKKNLVLFVGEMSNI